MTTATQPSRARLRALLLAALAALAALLSGAGTASAAALPAAETRVGAITPAITHIVGVAEHIAAGQRPVRGPSQLQIVVGHCVAAEAGASGATRVFWTGGEAAETAATKYAVENGGETIGQTAVGRAAQAATRGLPWEQVEPVWMGASKTFAEGASGQAHAFINLELAREGSVWATTELPALVKNANVSDVIFHLIRG